MNKSICIPQYNRSLAVAVHAAHEAASSFDSAVLYDAAWLVRMALYMARRWHDKAGVRELEELLKTLVNRQQIMILFDGLLLAAMQDEPGALAWLHTAEREVLTLETEPDTVQLRERAVWEVSAWKAVIGHLLVACNPNRAAFTAAPKVDPALMTQYARSVKQLLLRRDLSPNSVTAEDAPAIAQFDDAITATVAFIDQLEAAANDRRASPHPWETAEDLAERKALMAQLAFVLKSLLATAKGRFAKLKAALDR
jgi:hypothetical protein